MHQSTLSRIVAVLGLALTLFGTTQTAQAGTTPPVHRTLILTPCLNVYTYGPSGCSSALPSRPVWLLGTKPKGIALDYPSTPLQVSGTFSFTLDRSLVVIRFNNPSPRTWSTVYTGTTYAGGGIYCYRGAMLNDNLGPDESGVWVGCFLP